MERKERSRREILKKAGIVSAFVTPTVISFKLADLAVAASNCAPPPPPKGLEQPCP